MKNKRSGLIVFTIDNPPPFAGGGAGKLAMKLARALRQKGCQIKIITPNPFGRQIFEKNIGGVEVVFLPCYIRNPECVYSVIYNIRLVLWLLKQRGELIAIHLRGMRGIFSLQLFSKWSHVPLFATALSEDNWRLLNPLPPLNPYRWLVHRMLKHVDVFVALSRRLAEVMSREGISTDKIVHIPNGAEIPDLPVDRPEVRVRLGLPEKKLIVLYAGRLHPQKDVFFLLRCWKDFIRQRPASQLVLIGEGPQKNEIQRYLIDHGLVENVLCPGYVDHVANYMAAADVFVLPSRREGCSNALLEAMAHELPCIATDSPGNDEVIDNETTGFLVEFDNLVQLQFVLIRLCDDPAIRQRVGQAAREHVRESFSLEQNAQRHIDLYLANTLQSYLHRRS